MPHNHPACRRGAGGAHLHSAPDAGALRASVPAVRQEAGRARGASDGEESAGDARAATAGRQARQELRDRRALPAGRLSRAMSQSALAAAARANTVHTGNAGERERTRAGD